MEPHLGQSCPLQHSMEHMKHTIRGDRPTAGRGKHPGAIAHFLSLFFQNAYRILCQGQDTVSVFRFQRCFHHFPVDAGDLPPYPEVTPFQINARTAGICGAERGRSRPLSFLLLYFRRLPTAPKIGHDPLKRPCWGSYTPHPPRGHTSPHKRNGAGKFRCLLSCKHGTVMVHWFQESKPHIRFSKIDEEG